MGSFHVWEGIRSTESKTQDVVGEVGSSLGTETERRHGDVSKRQGFFGVGVKDRVDEVVPVHGDLHFLAIADDPLVAAQDAFEIGRAPRAVVALQTVLRAVPDSSAAWEALGAAYDALSKHSAALKAYRRAVEIESNFKHKPDGGSGRVFASTQSGRIMHQMGAVSEAIAAYESALAVVPGHTAALLGLAAAELQRSYMFLRI